MRRRSRQEWLEVPEHLLHFRPAEWAEDTEEATTLWSEARFKWLRAHRDEIDGVWFLAQQHDERRRVLYGIEPPPRWPRLR